MKPVIPETSVLNWIKSRCLASDEVLDLGCGEGRYRELGVVGYTGIDSWPSCSPNIVLDLNKVDIPFPEDSFDIVLMIDFIEHLPKWRSIQLIRQAQEVCKREVLIMTPIKWSINEKSFKNPESIHHNNPHIVHKSIWSAFDFMTPGWHRDTLFVDGTKSESQVSKEMLSYRWVK